MQKNKGGKYMHYGKMTGGALRLGDTVSAAIDVKRRKAVMRAHSATHLLDKALRTVLGDHVHQAGSLVEPDRLRFDFTHFSAMTPEELAQVNTMVNEAVLEGYDIRTDVLPIEEAKKRGAIALFGEKYGDTVRVVDMGRGLQRGVLRRHPSGQHRQGGRVPHPERVLRGQRRPPDRGHHGPGLLDVMDRNQEMLFAAAAALKTKPGELRARAEGHHGGGQAAWPDGGEIQGPGIRREAGRPDRFLLGGHIVGGLRVITASVGEADTAKLRQMGDTLRDKERAPWWPSWPAPPGRRSPSWPSAARRP